MTRCAHCDSDSGCRCFFAEPTTARDPREPPLDAPDGWSAPEWTRTSVPDRWSRTRGSEVTFGLVGRLAATILMFVPLAFFVSQAAIAWPGIVIWTFVVLPWGLRDIWRRVRV